MARIFFKKAGRKPSFFATLGLFTAIVAAATSLLAGPIAGYLQPILGPNEQIYIWRLKLLAVTEFLLVTSITLTIFGIMHGRYSIRFRTSWRGFVSALLCTLVSLPVWMMYEAKHAPLLHDVTTDLLHSPAFSVLQSRHYDVKNTNLKGGPKDPTYQPTHKSNHPNLSSIHLDLKATDLVTIVQKTLITLGWKTAMPGKSKTRIEATVIHIWLQQKSNIVVRIQETAGRSTLDIRSVSALELGDFGVNALHIEAFMNQLKLELSG